MTIIRSRSLNSLQEIFRHFTVQLRSKIGFQLNNVETGLSLFHEHIILSQVTTSVVKAVGNLVGSLEDSESSSPELAASSSSVVHSVEKQVSLTLQNSDEFSLTAENMIVRASTLDVTAMENGIEFDGGGDSTASIQLPSSIFNQAGPVVDGIPSPGVYRTSFFVLPLFNIRRFSFPYWS